MEKIWLTPDASEEETEDESPPLLVLPQVITEPSSFRTAKALIFSHSLFVLPGLACLTSAPRLEVLVDESILLTVDESVDVLLTVSFSIALTVSFSIAMTVSFSMLLIVLLITLFL